MPIPTEILNEDVKELKADLRDIRSNLDVLKADVHRIDIGLARLLAEFGLAKWLLGLLLVATLSGIGSGIWWASKMDTKVNALELRFDKMEARFDRLETSIAKLIEQTRPAKP